MLFMLYLVTNLNAVKLSDMQIIFGSIKILTNIQTPPLQAKGQRRQAKIPGRRLNNFICLVWLYTVCCMLVQLLWLVYIGRDMNFQYIDELTYFPSRVPSVPFREFIPYPYVSSYHFCSTLT